MSKREKSKTWGTPQLIVAALILLLIVGGMTFAILWQINEFSLNLTINGPDEVTVEYGESYTEPGAGAIFRGTVFFQEPTDIEVTTEGQVDVSRVGTYHITYRAQRVVNYLFGEVVVTDHAQRTVHVVDTVAPEISLTSDPETFTIPGEAYLEEGFTATDNYDGDITDRVVRTECDGVIHYEVTDSSGNTTIVDRTIVYHDPVAPSLVLKGDQTMSIKLGSEYEEPGYVATDNVDGVITDRVTVTGQVDTSKVGTYTLEYSVTDSYENTATIQRTVKVYKPKTETKPTEPTEPEVKPVEPANPTGGVIYLTFDDGPGRHTGRLLDILAKYNVKATFFMVNTGYISTAARMAAEGHAVAMHSVTHDFAEIYASEEAFFADLEKMQSIIQQHTGIKSMLMRFPGGSSNTISRRYCEGIMTRLTEQVEEKGYTYFDWNVDSRDAGGASTATEVYNNVVSGVASRKASVVLMHDIKSYTVDAIEDIIVWGLENGYTFRALTADSPTCHHRVAN